VSYEGASTRLDLNDAGYLRQSNVHDFGGAVGFRTTSPVGITLNSETDLSADTLFSTDGVRLGHALVLNPFVRFTNYMQVFGALIFKPSAYDIRETRDGAPYERTRTWAGTVGGSTDNRAPVGVSGYVHAGNTLRGLDLHTSATAWLNLFGRVELRLTPQVDVTTGDPRWYETQGDPAGGHTYRFADLDARAYSLTLNGTYTFSPTLSLQAQGQLYFDTAHYGQGWAVDSVTPRPYLYLERLKPAATEPGLDYKDGALNLSVVLRWEYLPGSVLFLVYSRAQANGDPTLGQSPLHLDGPSLRHGPSDDVLLVKASFYFGA
jgi:hypothetical protein